MARSVLFVGNMTPDERDERDKYGIDAGRKYDDNVRQFVKAGRVEPSAQEARRSVEGPDGPQLHDAEVDSARHGAMPGDPPWMGRVREAAHHAVDRVLTSIAHAEGWVKAHAPKGGYTGDGRPSDRR